ncbi:MAG: hypothetical protein AAGH83_07665 [Pseudomonadota bacterium]
MLQTMQSALSVVALIVASVMSFAWNGLAFAAVAELAGSGRAGTALGLHDTLTRLLTLPTALLFGWLAASIGWSATIKAVAVFPLVGT